MSRLDPGVPTWSTCEIIDSEAQVFPKNHVSKRIVQRRFVVTGRLRWSLCALFAALGKERRWQHVNEERLGWHTARRQRF